MKPRPYQSKVIGDVRDAYRGGSRAVLVVVPTGGGKTVIFSLVSEGTVAKGRRVVVLVHRQELIKQASEKLQQAGVDHGVIAPGRTATRDLCQVASVQTLAARLGDPRYKPPHLIVVDEAHHATAAQWAAILAEYSQAYVLGVTATPQRLDNRGLGTKAGGPFDTLIEGPTISELMAEGYLTRTKVFSPPDPPDMSEARIMAGEFTAKSMEEIVGKPQIVGDAVAEYIKHCPGAPAILFSPTVAHAEVMAAAFRKAGFRAAAASAKTKNREAIIAGLETGEVQVLCSCDLISEGLDIPAVACVILMRRTMSLSLYLQQVGRGLRPIWGKPLGAWAETKEGRLAAIAASSKPHLIVLDLVANWIAHGLPEDDREWSLDGIKPKTGEKEPKAMQCSACYAVHEPFRICPTCGAVVEIEGGRKREIEHVGGELQEVTAERQKARRAMIAALSYEEAAGMAQSLEEMKEIGEARGYKTSWAAKEWREQERRRKKAA